MNWIRSDMSHIVQSDTNTLYTTSVTMTRTDLVETDEVSETVVDDLVGPKELIVSVESVNEVMFAPVTGPVWYCVASHPLTHSHQEGAEGAVD